MVYVRTSIADQIAGFEAQIEVLKKAGCYICGGRQPAGRPTSIWQLSASRSASVLTMLESLRRLFNGRISRAYCRILTPCAASRRAAVIHRKRIERRVRSMIGMPEITWKRVEERRAEYELWSMGYGSHNARYG